MQTFNFPYHTISVEYPESSKTMKFGRGYEFASKPDGPDQVKYTLHFFEGMSYFVTNGQPDRTVNPTRNILTLEDFYKEHRMYEKFIYPHPAEGNVIVRFASPLKYEQRPLGLGVIKAFDVELITQP